MYDEKCMNMLKSSLITCYFATWGQHNQQEKSGTKPNQQNWKNLQEIEFSQPNTKINPNPKF